MLYHANFGPPTLEKGATFVAAVDTVAPFNAKATEGLDCWDRYAGPTRGFGEHVFCVIPHADAAGMTTVGLVNQRKVCRAPSPYLSPACPWPLRPSATPSHSPRAARDSGARLASKPSIDRHGRTAAWRCATTRRRFRRSRYGRIRTRLRRATSRASSPALASAASVRSSGRRVACRRCLLEAQWPLVLKSRLSVTRPPCRRFRLTSPRSMAFIAVARLEL